MERVGAVGQAGAVAAFLQAELESERFSPVLRRALAEAGEDDALLLEADLGDAAANARRHEILFAYRGGYLGRWFDDLSWSRIALDPSEVLAIRYIDWDYWLGITGGTRLPTDGAAYHRARGEDDRYVEGGPPLIAVRADSSSHLVVLEGHWRLTAMAMHPEEIPPSLEFLLGEGDVVRRWGCY